MSDSGGPRPAAGNIYDLGYRHYDGPRLGRAHAIRSLFLSSLRGVFGIGRGGRAKIAPFTIAALTLLPALVAVGLDVLLSQTFGSNQGPRGLESPIDYGTYLGLSMTMLILFCAAQAPELVGRDQRYRVLVLYFSRALRRTDYALAKLAALAAGLIAVYGVPLLVIFVGRVLASRDVPAAFLDNLPKVAPALLVGPIVALVLGGLSLAMAAMTPRRAYATAGIIALFVIPPVVIAVIQEVGRGDLARAVVLAGPSQVLDGVNAYLFNRTAGDDLVRFARLPGPVHLAVAVGMIAGAVAVLIRRYGRIDA